MHRDRNLQFLGTRRSDTMDSSEQDSSFLLLVHVRELRNLSDRDQVSDSSPCDGVLQSKCQHTMEMRRPLKSSVPLR